MILAVAAGLFAVALLIVTFVPRLDPEARHNAQFELAAFGTLGILTAGFFWQILFTQTAWMPAGGGDLAGFLYPTYSFAQRWITQGVLPLWNPYIFGGTPFVGDIQTSLFYPLNLITYFLSNPLKYQDLEYLAVLHFYIAGAGMYAFLRYAPLRDDGHGLNRFAALAGALAFEFSDLFITHFGNLNLIASAAWLPLIFLFFMRALEANLSVPLRRFRENKAALRNALLSAIFLALSFFAGHVQPYLFIVLALALYTAFVMLTRRAQWKRAALLFMLTLTIGVGLNAIIFLPALELTQFSVRSAFTYQNAVQYSLPPLELVGILVPGFFGRGATDAWGPWARVEVGYLGVFPLVLAAFALLLRRNQKTIFMALLALTGLLLALGGYAILHGWLFQFVPGFGQLRAPARFVFLFDFGMAALAGLGFDALLAASHETVRNKVRAAMRYVFGIALIIAVASGALALGILILGQGQDPTLFQRIANAANALAFFILLLALSMALLFVWTRHRLSPRVWSVLALALIAFDLFSLGAYVDVGTSDPTLAYRRADLVAFLNTNTGLARIDSRTDAEGLWRPDTGLLYGFQDVYGDNPLVLNSFSTYWDNAGGRDSAAYQLLNVKFVLTRRGTPMPENFVKVFDGGGLTVWENKTLAPRAWFVENPPRTENGIDVTNVPFDTTGITITGYGPNEIVTQVNTLRNSFLVLSEIYVPGWHAFVDGQEAAITRANNLFRAVEIPAGQHQLRMVYEPAPYRIGMLVSGIFLVSVIGLLVWLLRR